MKRFPKPKIKEADITRQIRQYLDMQGIFHWKQWQGPMSQPKGVSDIIGIYKGRFLAIEIKKPGGKLTPMQAVFILKVNASGGIGFMATSIDDVIERLRMCD